MTDQTNCTCRPWNAVIPPPPCPVHSLVERERPPWDWWMGSPFRTWATTMTTTAAPAREPESSCEVNEAPFCGWDDALSTLAERRLVSNGYYWHLSDVDLDDLDFDGIDEYGVMVTMYGKVACRAMDVLDVADEIILECPWLEHYDRTSRLGRLGVAVRAWRDAKAEQAAEPDPTGDPTPETSEAPDVEPTTERELSCDPDAPADLLVSHLIADLGDLRERVLRLERITEEFWAEAVKRRSDATPAEAVPGHWTPPAARKERST